MDFIKFRKKFEKIKANYKKGKLDNDAYNNAFKDFYLTDSGGSVWTINPNTEKWMIYEDNQWIEREPLSLAKPKEKKTFFDFLSAGAAVLYIISFVLMTSLYGFNFIEFLIAIAALICVATIYLPLFVPSLSDKKLFLTLAYIIIAAGISVRVYMQFFNSIEAIAAFIMYLSVIGFTIVIFNKIIKIIRKA